MQNSNQNRCPECEKNSESLLYRQTMEEGGEWIQSAIKHPGRCTPGSPNYDCPEGSPQWNLAQRFKHGDLHKEETGGMIKRADGSYSKRGLWDNIRANAGSGKKPTSEMLEQERKINKAQQGGEQRDQMMQIIMAYAQLHQVKPEEVIQQIQKLSPEEQQQAMQTMVTELQGDQGGQPESQVAEQTEYPQEGGFANGGNIPDGNPYGGNEYRYDDGGSYPVSGMTGMGDRAGRGLPYAVPMINATVGDAPIFEPFKAITGYMGAATSLAGAGLGFGKAAQWAGNKLLPEGKFKSGFNNVLNVANDVTKGIMDFGSDLNTQGLYSNQMQKQLQQSTRPLDQKYIREARNEKGPNLYYSKPVNGPEYQGQYDTMTAEYGGYISPVDMYANGGYTVRKSNDRKGKTHVVTGPDGTKKYFGDPNMGERSKSKNGKDAFYARHATNLKNNPYFRAYARSTWEDGGTLPQAQFGFSNPQGPPYAQQNNALDPNQFPQNNTTDAFTRSQGQQSYDQYNNAVRSFSNPFDTNNMSQFDLNNFNKNKIPFPKPPQAPEDYTVDESQFPQRQGNDMASMINQDNQIVGKEFETENNLNPLSGTQAKSTDFNGMDYAQKANAGAGAFLNYLQYKNNRSRKRDYDAMLKRKNNTDYGIANNTPSQGNYTLNVGFQNFQPGKTTPIQSVTGKYGGTLNRKQYKSGGEYQVSEDELLQLMQNGAEIEFINK
jgi:hypothetical protein